MATIVAFLALTFVPKGYERESFAGKMAHKPGWGRARALPFGQQVAVHLR